MGESVPGDGRGIELDNCRTVGSAHLVGPVCCALFGINQHWIVLYAGFSDLLSALAG